MRNTFHLPSPVLHASACGGSFRAGALVGAIEALLVVALVALLIGAARAVIRQMREAIHG